MLSTFVSAFVATCFVLSALFKVRNAQEFEAAIDEYSLLQILPRVMRAALVVAVPFVEGAVAVLLIIPETRRFGAVSAVCLALGFVVIVGLDPRRAIAHCGCWNVGSAEVPKSIYLVRSTVLLFACIGVVAITVGGTASWSTSVEAEALALTAPFALLLLELPQIAQIVWVQHLARG
jgi:Methylamine utilisation protein MauE